MRTFQTEAEFNQFCLTNYGTDREGNPSTVIESFDTFADWLRTTDYKPGDDINVMRSKNADKTTRWAMIGGKKIFIPEKNLAAFTAGKINDLGALKSWFVTKVDTGQQDEDGNPIFKVNAEASFWVSKSANSEVEATVSF
jgi:hypothetical protein